MYKIKVIPCSGIGKVHGAMSREAALETIKKSPEKFEAVCLAHIVTGETEGKEKVKNCDCITIDGKVVSYGKVLNKDEAVAVLRKVRG